MDATSRGGWMDTLVRGGEWMRYVPVVELMPYVGVVG